MPLSLLLQKCPVCLVFVVRTTNWTSVTQGGPECKAVAKTCSAAPKMPQAPSALLNEVLPQAPSKKSGRSEES